MNQNKSLNPKILDGINKQCENENLRKFIKELIGFEADHPNTFRFNKEYEKILNKYCNGDEN